MRKKKEEKNLQQKLPPDSSIDEQNYTCIFTTYLEVFCFKMIKYLKHSHIHSHSV